MHDLLSEQEQQRSLLRDSVAGFCGKMAGVNRLRTLNKNAVDFDNKLWRQMAQMGWAGLWIPEDRGGLGLSLLDMAVVAEELGKVAAPEPLIETAVLAGAVLAKVDQSELTRTLLEQVVTGEKVLVVARSDHYNKAQRGHAKAVKKGFSLNVVQPNVQLVEISDGFIMPLQLDGELALFWVTKETQGISITAQVNSDGTRSGTITLGDSLVPTESLIAQGDTALSALRYATDAAYIMASAYLLGLIERTLEITLEYMRTRQQFGRAIGSFQALQHRAVNLFIQQEITRSVVNEVAMAFEYENDLCKRAASANRAKHRSTTAALLVMREAIQLHGAIGFTLECDLALYVNRSLVVSAQYGNAYQQRKAFLEAAPYHVEESAVVPKPKIIEAPADNDWNSMSDKNFRIIVRHFFEEEYPEDKRFPSRKLHWPEIKDWYMTVSRKGWLAPNWPIEYGGMGLEPSKLIIFIEEQERWGVARTPADLGLSMVGPMLIHHGNDVQRREYLPKILSGDHIWCQGYSEPNAGSDLASLRTEAVLDGNDFIVNGQKTWTTMALDANYMFLLVRTDKKAKKQSGISFLLLDFNSPGITVRPIKNLAGNEEFCEVFLDNVKVPKENLVGKLHHGWAIAKSLLTFERLFLGSPKQSQYALRRLAELAEERRLFDDPIFLDHFTKLRLDVLDLESTYGRFAEQVKRGKLLGPDISILKIWATETCSSLSELMVEAAGYDGATLGPLGDSGVDALSQYYYSRPGPIYGGSNEIQRNILAKQVLELPSG
jgi:alkylation response protein AidB-like acyl-CoA dehydrogenase